VLFHAKRLRSDVRGAKGWLAAIALTSFVISVVTTYLASFGVTDIRDGTLSVDPPSEPLSFLRVVDPDDSIVKTLDDMGEMNAGLRTAGLSVLLNRMSHDDRMFLTLPLGAFMSNRAYFSEMATSGLAVVGRSPAFLRDAAPVGRGPLLWGSVPDGLPGLSDSHLGPPELHQVSDAPLSSSYVAGNGRRMEAGSETAVFLSPADAQTLGVSVATYSVSDVVGAFTCNCDVGELAPLARAMTLADETAGSHRVYYALPYDGLIGPVERSASASEVLDMTLAAGTLLGVCGFAYMAVLMFWKRREHDYRVEQRAGAGEVALQLRQQVIIFVGVTLPVAAGFLLVDVGIRVDQPVPWQPFGGPVAPLVIAAFHVALGAATAIKVHHLYSRSSQG
jgi:hypothetical protein